MLTTIIHLLLHSQSWRLLLARHGKFEHCNLSKVSKARSLMVDEAVENNNGTTHSE